MALLRGYGAKSPRLHESVFAVESAVVVGDVEIGAESSLWFGAVVRGDVSSIRIGARTNLQDYAVVHVSGGAPTVVGDDVTVGHRATLHGCTVEDRCLVGIGAIVMDGAVVGEESIVAAGTLVPPRLVIPPRSLAVGAPAKVRRALAPEEIERLSASARRYVGYARQYRAEGWR